MSSEEVFIKKQVKDSRCQITRLSGGNINHVYKVVSNNTVSVFKINKEKIFPQMLEKEALGLALLRNTNTFKIPDVIKVGKGDGNQFLEMEFIDIEQTKSTFFLEKFGINLAKLHSHSATNFGLEHSNYIGSLSQSNKYCSSWASFLINERLLPQLVLARDQNVIDATETKEIECFFNYCDALWPIEPPALLHGDLWSGNYLEGKNNETILIDPAVYFGHREMDLGMMHLFGGFDPFVFEIYAENSNLEQGWKERLNYNQLYPLLVHLNLFGRNYYTQVKDIIRPFIK